MPPKEKKFVPPLNLTQRSINCLNEQHKSCQATALMCAKSYHAMIWSGRKNFLCAIFFTFSTVRLTFKFQTRPHQTSKIKNLQKHSIQDHINTQPTSYITQKTHNRQCHIPEHQVETDQYDSHPQYTVSRQQLLQHAKKWQQKMSHFIDKIIHSLIETTIITIINC